MLESFVVDSTTLLLLAFIAVNLLLIIKDIIDLYRRTTHVAYRTGITVTELRKMLGSRRLKSCNRWSGDDKGEAGSVHPASP